MKFLDTTGAIQAARAKAVEARALTVAAGAELAQIAVAHKDAARGGKSLAAEHEAALAKCQGARRAGRAARGDLTAAIASALPATLDEEVRSLDAQHPIALLPVQLEAHFALDGADGQGKQLLIRVYPDGIFGDAHEPELTPAELRAGQAYWTNGWDPPAEAGQWTRLAPRYGPTRAAWIVQATEPTNLDARPAGKPAFGAPPSRGASWTRPVLARVLPDRWLAIAH